MRGLKTLFFVGLIFLSGMLIGGNIAVWRFTCEFSNEIITVGTRDILISCFIALGSAAALVLRTR